MLRLQDDNGVPMCPKKDARKMTAPYMACRSKAKDDSEGYIYEKENE